MRSTSFVLFFLALLYLRGNGQALPRDIISPGGKLRAVFNLDPVNNELSYRVIYRERPVILKSALGITWNGITWNDQLILESQTNRQQDTTWHPMYGERSTVRDHFNETTLTLGKKGFAGRKLQIVVRAYDQGIAFRYVFPELPDGGPYLRITEEATLFSFPDKTQAWYTPRAQTLYQLLPLKSWPGESERPLTLELPNGLYVCLGEAGLVNYSRTKFKLHAGSPNAILCSMYDAVDEIAPFSSPWRVIMVAEQPGDLLVNNDIILNLNPPCAIKNAEWIKPGKVMREITLSTGGAKKLVDFAVKRNLQYIHFDAGWYGYEYAAASNATRVEVDPRRNPKNDLNLPEAIRYARSHNIGVILYVNQRALAAQLDSILPLYEKWGVAGVKFGFVQVGSHRWTTWLHDAIKKCAQYHLMVNIHDEYRPTGFSRTYPNLMTQEGILGNEGMPDAMHNTILPFTRFVAGAADYTFCYYYRKEFGHPERHIRTTPAHQLALPVIFYSPWQYMYWYDKPEDYQGEPELEFWDTLPTTWDDTKVVQGGIGKYITVARKSGEDWFVGAITGNEERDMKIPLDFLDAGKKYEASIYSDDPGVNTRTKVAIKRMIVNASTVLDARLQPSGGQAIRITAVK
ncbi:MAG: glycoside hydrolase family 97 N-terminal domain-containing protein [Chitinophagaceae bacterium]|nr:glycoside hydrolase family 97 N-terminal domain-containing protein [Chitinophagaceae bacterium]